MKIFVGFAFTNEPVSELRSRGFTVETTSGEPSQGYIAHYLKFTSAMLVEIRQIIDEDLYLEHHSIKHFAPFTQESSSILSGESVHPNGVFAIEQDYSEKNIPDSQLCTFFQIRKQFSPWALLLECKDLKIFQKVARPDRMFQMANGEFNALIHLGPNCFDFLVKQTNRI